VSDRHGTDRAFRSESCRPIDVVDKPEIFVDMKPLLLSDRIELRRDDARPFLSPMLLCEQSVVGELCGMRVPEHPEDGTVATRFIKVGCTHSHHWLSMILNIRIRREKSKAPPRGRITPRSYHAGSGGRPVPDSPSSRAAPALFPLHGAADDQFRALDKIPKFDKPLRHPGLLVERFHFVSHKFHPPQRTFQPMIRPDDPDIVPHDLLDFPAIVRHENPLFAVERPGVIPRTDGGNRRSGGTKVLDGCPGSRSEKTSASRRELLASRFAPWTPVIPTSPAA